MNPAESVRVHALGLTRLCPGEAEMPLMVRRLLAVLAAHSNEVLAADALADLLWDGSPPASAAAALRVHVSRLRQELSAAALAGRLRSVKPGYSLMLADSELDVRVFESLVRQARAALEDAPERALDLALTALGLWGRPYVDLAEHAFVQPEQRRLLELHAELLQTRVEALVALRRWAEAEREAAVASDAYPFRERLVELRMFALFRDGRQQESLELFDATRRLLADELGCDPGPGLRRLHEQVLAHDRQLLTDPAEASSERAVAVLDCRLDAAAEQDLLPVLHEVVALVGARGGEVVSVDGAGLVVSFDDAVSALAAGDTVLQSVLGRASARVGVHQGVLRRRGRAWSGPALRQVRAVVDASVPGQLLSTVGPVPVVRPVGEFWLPGFSTPVELFAGSVPGPQAVRARLPVPEQHVRLHGRGDDLDAVAGLLSEHRLVSLTGPGGVGKTTLAISLLHARARLGWRVAAVELAAVAEATSVAEAVRRALGVPVGEPWFAVLDREPDRGLLVVLDNCEHLLDAVRELVPHLIAAGLRLLLTSREPLDVASEQVYRLGPLVVPSAGDPPELIEAAASVVLFRERALAVQALDVDTAAPASLARVCGLLDGLPLALELAAARTRSMTVAELEQSLGGEGALDLQRAAGSERHRTLSGTVRWSYELLDVDEQRVLRALGSFAGAVPAAAVQAVLGAAVPAGRLAALLDSLVAKSLLTATAGSAGTLFTMLVTVRAVARQLAAEAGEQQADAVAHTRWLLSHVDASGLDLMQDPGALRAVDEVAVELRSAAAQGLALPAGLHSELLLRTFPYWAARPVRQASDWYLQLFHRTDAEAGERALAFAHAAWLRYHHADPLDREQQLFGAALELARAADDAFVLATTLRCAATAVMRVQPDDAKDLSLQALAVAEAAGDAYNRSRCLNVIGGTRFFSGELEEAMRWYADALEVDEQVGDHAHRALALFNLGEALLELGRAADAVPYLTACVQLETQLDVQSLVLEGGVLLLRALHEAGDGAAACAQGAELLHLARAFGDRVRRRELATLLEQVAAVAGQDALAAEARGELAQLA